MTAQAAVLAGESEDELNDLARRLRAGLGPAYGVESVLVERIVAIEWKFRRLAAAEQAACEREERTRMGNWEVICKNDREWPGIAPKPGPRPQPRTAGEILSIQFFRKPEDAPLLRMAEHEARMTATLLHAVRDLQRLHAARDAEDRPAGEQEQEQEEEPRPEEQQEIAPATGPTPLQRQEQGQKPQDEKPQAEPPGRQPAPPPPDALSTAIAGETVTIKFDPQAPTETRPAAEPEAAAPAAHGEPNSQNEPTTPQEKPRAAAIPAPAPASTSTRQTAAKLHLAQSPRRENEPTARQRNGPIASLNERPPVSAPGP